MLGYRMRRGRATCSTCLRWTVPGDARPPDPFDVQRHTVVPRPRGSGRHEVRVPQRAVSRTRTCAAPASSAGTRPRRSSSTALGWSTPANGSCTRTTRASTTSRTSSGCTTRYYARELAFADRLVGDLLDGAAGPRHAARHCRSRPDPSRTRRLDRPHRARDRWSTRWQATVASATCTRASGAAKELAGGRARAARRSTRGCGRAASCSTTAGSARARPGPSRVASATSCSRPRDAVRVRRSRARERGPPALRSRQPHRRRDVRAARRRAGNGCVACRTRRWSRARRRVHARRLAAAARSPPAGAGRGSVRVRI